MARLVNIIHFNLKIVNKPGEHWKVHLNDRSPHDPYRRWMYDWRGLRKDDWHSAPNECLEKVEKVYLSLLSLCRTLSTLYEPFYSKNDHELIPLEKILESHKANHPEILLRECLYRDPKVVLEQKKVGKHACYSICKYVYKPPPVKKIGDQDVKRYQFMSNNYVNFDDGYAVDFNH
ncbi:unnamed protein product [Hymenolepis diminuta]|uniref:39S ribosomal protein L50, mitochondrial n=1 Tax=Hymenolepis diminuta TaxID=6216 RepID=A0A0R3SAX3_HYMDI|nr:unnamed protein product [Hymenolepis diminuta]